MYPDSVEFLMISLLMNSSNYVSNCPKNPLRAFWKPSPATYRLLWKNLRIWAPIKNAILDFVALILQSMFYNFENIICLL